MNANRELQFTSLFSTNRAPNSIEAASIQTDIDGLLREKVQLEARITELNKDIERNRAVLSPLRRFPTEVLGEIFGIMIPSVLDDAGRQQLVALQLVCRWWRDTSHIVNRLWSGIQVHPTHPAHSYEKIANWLGRSGSVAKTLHWTPQPGPWYLRCCPTRLTRVHQLPKDCALVNSVMVKLLTEGPKIDNLKLVCEHTDCFRHLVNAIRASKAKPKARPWHSLKSIAIEFQNVFANWLDPLQQNGGPFLHLIPPVASLDIQFPRDSDVFFEARTDEARIEQAKRAVIDIPSSVLGQLTTLTFTCDWPGDHLLKVLQHCENLTMLTIDFNGSSFDPNVDDEGAGLNGQLRPSPVLLPNVHTLCSRMNDSLSVLKYLKLPNLLSLDIGMFGVQNDEPLEPSEFSSPIVYFAKQSGILDSLRFLRLYCLHIPTDQLILVLDSFPSLTHLILDRLNVAWSDLLEELLDRVESGDQPCLPAVETLEILQIPPSYPVDTLLDFLSCPGSEQPKQQRYLTLSYGDFFQTPWSETDFDKEVKLREGVKMKVRILPPVSHFMEGRRS